MFHLKVSFVTNEGNVNVEFDKKLPLSKSRILKNLSKLGVQQQVVRCLSQKGEVAIGYANGKRVYQLAKLTPRKI